MKNIKYLLFTVIMLVVSMSLVLFFLSREGDKTSVKNDKILNLSSSEDETEETSSGVVATTEPGHPMAIESLRRGEYPGGDFVIEEKLANGVGYTQSVVSYLSDDLKIYGLLTVPLGERPAQGWPAVVFVHGYIPPREYSTTGSYPSYQARLAQGGVVTFKPDLRGHGESEGEAVSAHFSEKYVIDTLNALAYLKDYPAVDPARLGYWGHSNGGEIGLRVLLASDDIKAASLWAGVVGSYEDMFETYNEQISFLRDAAASDLVRRYGLPSENPEFWNQLDPYNYLGEIDAAIQLQHASGDESVPIVLSDRLHEELIGAGQAVEYFRYSGDDHNIGSNSSLAWQRTIDFFKKHLVDTGNVIAPVDSRLE